MYSIILSKRRRDGRVLCECEIVERRLERRNPRQVLERRITRELERGFFELDNKSTRNLRIDFIREGDDARDTKELRLALRARRVLDDEDGRVGDQSRRHRAENVGQFLGWILKNVVFAEIGEQLRDGLDEMLGGRDAREGDLTL